MRHTHTHTHAHTRTHTHTHTTSASVYYPNQQMHKTYTLTIFYTSQVLPLHVWMHLHHPQGVLSFYFAKVTKIFMVTNSIKSVEWNVHVIVVVVVVVVVVVDDDYDDDDDNNNNNNKF